MIRLILGIYFVLMGFYAISNPHKLVQLGKKSKHTKDNNVVGVMLGGMGSVVIGLLFILWLILF